MANFHESFSYEKTLKKVMANFHESFSYEGMLKGIITVAFVWVFIFVLCSSFVFAAGGWNDFNNGSSGVKNTNVSVADNNRTIVKNNASLVSDSGGSWTLNFYIALGLGFLILIIIGFFLWFWIRGSKNKWE